MPLKQAGLNEIVDDRVEVRDFFTAEVAGALIEIQAAIQAQTEKESLFERGVAVDAVGLRRRSSDVVFQRVGGGESGGGISAHEHRMRVDAEAEIGLTSPILEVMTGFKAAAGEVGDFILLDSRCI